MKQLLTSFVFLLAACGTKDKPADKTAAPPAPASATSSAVAAPDAAAAAPAPTFATYETALSGGRKLAKAGALAEAKAAFEAALRLRTEDATALSELGYVELKLGNDGEALAITDRAIAAATDPKLKAASLYNRGRLLEQRGDLPGAKAAYTESLALRPNATVQARLDKLGSPPDMATPDGVAAFKQIYKSVRDVPWPSLAYACGEPCTAKLHKVIYGDVEGDGTEEAIVVVQGAFGLDSDHTAHLYGVRANEVAWLGRIHTGGREHPEYAPRFQNATLANGAVQITWHFQLWGNCDDPDDCADTVTETYKLAGGKVVDENGAPTR